MRRDVGMAAHHGVIAFRANEACLSAVVSAAMHVIFHAWREHEARSQRRKIKHAREIDPLAAIFAPGLAAERHLEMTRKQLLLKRAQMLANH